ncbi:MAG TPA: zf-TFIIB domain-containing protein, partial [Desulfuromonadales bacterium]|nr:zf-TFIIB domain-containing protein [Desulfuromonadales bacterium]
MDTNIVTCAHCGHQIHGRVRVCPICGGEVVAAVSQKAAVCPRCGGALTDSDYHEHPAAKCSRCGGLWISGRAFETLTTERDVYRDESVPTSFVRQPPVDETGYLPCPCCGQRMNRLNFKRISGVL